MMHKVILLVAISLCWWTPSTLRAQAWEIGTEAPEVLGYDELGNPQRLSDFRGKHVFLNVATSWCYPSFVLAEATAAVKTRLKEKGIDLVLYTVLVQDPLRRPYPLRSQALSWKDSFPSTDVVAAKHIGLTNFLNRLPEINSLLGPIPQEHVYPTFAIIDPDGIVREISRGSKTADEILAFFLPDEPTLEPIAAPAPGIDVTKAKLKVQVGAKTAVQREFMKNHGGIIIIPGHQQGTLPSRFGLGLSREMAPGQEIWTLHYDTRLARSDTDPGIPQEAPVTFTITDRKWAGDRGVLPSTNAEVYLYDNVLPGSRAWTTVSYRNNKIVVGPFTVGSGFYHFRYIQVMFHVAKDDPRNLAVFGADETEALIGINEETRRGLVEQWRGIESALTAETPEFELAIERIKALRREIRFSEDPVLEGAQKRLFIRMLTRMRKAVHLQKAGLE